MAKYKIFLISVCAFICIIGIIGYKMIGQKGDENNFPLDERGYPQDDCMIVNGRQYMLENIRTDSLVPSKSGVVSIETSSDEIEVTLPQGGA